MCRCEILVHPGARRGYGAMVRHDDHAGRAAWRVTSGEPAPGAVERLLRLLPGWFGIESSVREYVEDARTRPAYLAWPGLPCLVMIKSLRTGTRPSTGSRPGR